MRGVDLPAALPTLFERFVDPFHVSNLVIQRPFGHEATDPERGHVRARRPAHVVHGEVFNALERQPFEGKVQGAGADEREPVLARDAVLQMNPRTSRK
jgi:hypothetical protein